jgi:hypothetical protein
MELPLNETAPLFLFYKSNAKYNDSEQKQNNARYAV